MKRLLDLSFRYKIPLWGSILIVVTTLVVSASLMVRAYYDIKKDMRSDSAAMGRALAANLFSDLQRNDIQLAFKIVTSTVRHPGPDTTINPKTIIALNNALRVVVSSNPKTMSTLAKLSGLGPEYATLGPRIKALPRNESRVIQWPGSHNIYVITPIASREKDIGMLVMVYSKDKLQARFFRAAGRGALMGLLVLAVLLPINWYWGQRMSRPLLLIASRIGTDGPGECHDLDPAIYPYADELGRLLETYCKMVKEQEHKKALERQMVQSERLAAVGRLAAGMAHEINNPLGGMLTAIDTLKSHGEADPRTAKTIALIERGLTQIRETVGALLVEARPRSRDLEPEDVEDVRSLVLPMAQKKALHFDWNVCLAQPLAIQAHLVRQILINLLLNAIHAAKPQGLVTCVAETEANTLRLVVENDGKLLTTEQAAQLFEPFSPLSEDGHGLGLWATYQIVQQLDGQITVDRNDKRMRFSVSLPLGETL